MRNTYSIKWSPKLAYAIGLIATDGNLSKDGRHLEITSKDYEQLENIQLCLGISNNITSKQGGYTKQRYPRMQFGNVKLYRWLLNIGLTPNKSKRIGPLKIPKRYFFHFLRGSFDGDGYIYSYYDKRWRNSYLIYLVFTSASREHLDWISNEIKYRLGFEGKINRNQTVFKLPYAKQASLALLKRMYPPNCICLSRKKDKITQILDLV